MAEHVLRTFAQCKVANRSALVAYIAAGYPSAEETPDILLGMEAGGADIVELGIPFTDPIADGPTIQRANTAALARGVTPASVLDMLREARAKGLRAPVMLMGYYNPVMRYGEERFLSDARKAGANGFIMVDLPPEEAVRFRDLSKKEGLSYIPLVAPSTSDARLKLLCSIADSFIYVVSRMGVTGATGSLSAGIDDLLSRVHKFAGNKPTALGFGISTREQFLEVGKMSEGVVIGSQIITVLGDAPKGEAAKRIQEYCTSITHRIVYRNATEKPLTWEIATGDAVAASAAQESVTPQVDGVVTDADVEMALSSAEHKMPDRFGEFGGQYVPESLISCLAELEDGFAAARSDPAFWEEFRSFYPYMSRPSTLHLADRLTAQVGGADIYLKREDLNHTGSHKINNALGQVLLARRLGKTRIIAETGAGQHGVATATVCAKFGLACTIYMGAEDVRRQALNVFRIKLLGASVVAVEAGSRTLRDAVNEALRAWVVDLDHTHYVVGSAIGPHPFPTIVRTLQSVIGKETREQIQALAGRLPDAVVACVGGGSNASGMFAPFAGDPTVRLVGVEAGGSSGVNLSGDPTKDTTGHHAATLTGGAAGVLHGFRTLILQDSNGMVAPTHSISAGLDYPGVGPELAAWQASGRARFFAATDAEATIGFRALTQAEGIIPALESAHAVWGAMEIAREVGKGGVVVICLSGRGDKDVQSVAEALPALGPQIGWDLRF